jgi:hypothetical protein
MTTLILLGSYSPHRLFNFSAQLWPTIVLETGLNRGRNRHYSALMSASWFNKTHK